MKRKTQIQELNKDDYYVVEAIRNRRINRKSGLTEYQVKWKNWPEKANTWEPEDNLKYVSSLLKAFERSLESEANRSCPKSTEVTSEMNGEERRRQPRTKIVRKEKQRRLRPSRSRSERQEDLVSEEGELRKSGEPANSKMRGINSGNSADYRKNQQSEEVSDSDGENPSNEGARSVGLENQAFLFEQSDGDLQAPVYVNPYRTRSRDPKQKILPPVAEAESTSMKELMEPTEFDPQSIRRGQIQIIDTAYVERKFVYRVKELDKLSEPVWIDAKVFTRLNPQVLANFYSKHVC